MIRSFRHKGVERFFKTGSKAGIQTSHVRRLNEQLTLAEERSRLAMASADRQASGTLGRQRQRKLAAHLTFDGEDAVLVDYQDYH